MPSVLRVANRQGKAQHPTEKPVALLRPLIEYSTVAGDVILDTFAGSGTTGVVAKALGRRAVLVEGQERYCAIAASRLSQNVLDFGAA